MVSSNCRTISLPTRADVRQWIVAAVVAGHVVAQGVEGHVGGRQVLGGDALDVLEEAQRDRLQTHDLGMDEQLDRLGPLPLAMQEPQRVGTDGADGAHPDHRATAPRDLEDLLVFLPGGEPGNPEGGHVPADRQLQDRGSRRAWGGVAQHDAAQGRLADPDAPGAQLDRRVVVPAAERERDGHQQHDDQQDGEGTQLDPAEPPPERTSQENGPDGDPPQRRHGAEHRIRAAGQRTDHRLGGVPGAASRPGDRRGGPVPGIGQRPQAWQAPATLLLLFTHWPWRSLGGSTLSSARAMTCVAVAPENSASGDMTSRWVHVGAASCLTSSGTA